MYLSLSLFSLRANVHIYLVSFFFVCVSFSPAVHDLFILSGVPGLLLYAVEVQYVEHTWTGSRVANAIIHSNGKMCASINIQKY